ncbi:MAG: DUF4129 domain-containing protein [Luteolibacter sp.]|uniref:DUF4129 domain-containing protein n=1 Tax=Luteolibacter sp. TaxID=1962973 RepID=UPI003266DAF9
MRLDSVTAEIRPRSDWEAVDLGFAMVRRDFWRCFTMWWLAMGIPTAIATVLLWRHPFLLLIVFWWMKPAGSRIVLFEISRRLFGEEPSWRAVWREIPKAWVRRFFYRYLWARLSPWLPVTLAVEDLEGLRGKAYKQRCVHVVRRGEGAVMWIYLVSHAAVIWFGLAILATLRMLIPEGQDGAWRQAMESWDSQNMAEMPLLIARSAVACMMLAMSLSDLFATGAGFGLYINNRTWIEGWDVELAFRRLAQRLGKVAVLLVSFFILGLSAHGQEAATPADRIQQVKAHKDFIVHTVTDRIPKSKSPSGFSFPSELMEILMYVFGISAVVLLLAFIGRAIWKNRHVFGMRMRGEKLQKAAPSARVVMGMEVSPDTLPGDVPSAAWALWQQGKHQEALGLLYRGSISRVMEIGRVEIQESDTEGDCMRRVDSAGNAAHPDYFRGITGAWIRLAYAGINPADADVQALCQQWPFGEGRAL